MPSHKTIKLLLEVPASFECVWYECATPDECAEALRIGATLHDTLKTMHANDEIKAIEERKNTEIIRIREHAAEQTASLQTQLQTAQSSLTDMQHRIHQLLENQRKELSFAASAEKERIQEQFKHQISELQHEIRLNQEKYDVLMERRKALEADREQDIRAAEERTQMLLQHTLDEKERAILRAEKTLETLHESYARQTDELRGLSDMLRKKTTNTNVKVKGTEYEALFREKLIAAFGVGERFELMDTARSGVGHAGDYLMKWGDHTILWEVKNYDKNVPTAEVDKFRRDVKDNPQVRIGVMVSRYTPITGKIQKGDRDIEFVEGKMLLYLSHFESMSDDTLMNLMFLFRVWWSCDNGHAEENETKETTIRIIEKLHTEALKAKTEWRLHKSRLDETIRWMAERVDEAETRLKNALNIIQGTVETLDIPDGIFRNYEGDERSQRDIQTILRHVTIDSSASLVLNDLAELFAKERSVTRDTAKTHIRAVLLDSVVNAHKGKTVRVTGMSLLDS